MRGCRSHARHVVKDVNGLGVIRDGMDRGRIRMWNDERGCPRKLGYDDAC
jgi:hypothetical protein